MSVTLASGVGLAPGSDIAALAASDLVDLDNGATTQMVAVGATVRASFAPCSGLADVDALLAGLARVAQIVRSLRSLR